MATLQVLSVPRSALNKTQVTKTTRADNTQLTTSLGTDGCMLVFDPAKIEHSEALHKAIELIQDKLAESRTWPPA